MNEMSEGQKEILREIRTQHPTAVAVDPWLVKVGDSSLAPKGDGSPYRWKAYPLSTPEEVEAAIRGVPKGCGIYIVPKDEGPTTQGERDKISARLQDVTDPSPEAQS